jgi:hypothetical protein
MDGQVVMKRVRSPALVLLGALASAAGLAPCAQAADPPTSDRRAFEARRACAAGRVEQGIELLAQIIAETGDPNAVYNQARCYQGNGRSEQALARFREYLRIAEGILPRERARVRRFIGELEREVESRRRRGLAPAPPPPSPPPEAALLPPPPDPIGLRAQAAPDPSVTRRHTLRVVALATAAAAVVPIAGAVLFAVQAQRIESEIENQTSPLSPADFDRKVQKGRRAATLQWVGVGLSGAMLAGAGTLYLLSRRNAEPAAPRVTLAPFVAGGGGALLSGRF